MTEAFERAYRPASPSSCRTSPSWSRRSRVEAAVASAPPPRPGSTLSPAAPQRRWLGSPRATCAAVAASASGTRPDPEPAERVRMFAAGEWATVPLYRRDALLPGQAVDGPAIIAEDLATTVVEPGWRASVTGGRDLLLTRVAAARPRAPRSRPAAPTDRRARRRADPVLLEVFSNLFMAVAEQMGERLRSTAHSVNIKERLDFSCAIFDADGGLIANAPHIPVHLGSMSESIKMVINRNKGRIKPGDVYALNDPYHGGTHLPDVTVITPVFAPPPTAPAPARTRAPGHNGDGPRDDLVLRRLPRPPRRDRRHLPRLDARGKHQDRGGGRPHRQLAPGRERPAAGGRDDGPADQRRVPVAEPGDQPRRPARPGRRQREGRRRNSAAWSRSTASTWCTPTWATSRRTPRRRSGTSSPRSATAAATTSSTTARDIRVKVTVDQAARTAAIDFTGTSPQLGGNFNAPSSVAMAAVLYVFRTLVDKDIPLNAGCLKPLTVIIPPGTMLSPEYPAAVAAGNVETSQAVTGALYAALGRHGRGLGHDEQRDVRQRPVPVLRDGRERLGRRRRLRRHRRGADEDDQLAAHRPRGPRMALPGPPRVLRDPPRQRRPTAAGAAATAAPGASASSSR